jgi:hypothetical protein
MLTQVAGEGDDGLAPFGTLVLQTLVIAVPDAHEHTHY